MNLKNVPNSNSSNEFEKHLPGPRIKPNAWHALMFAMELVLSWREVAPATYDLITATFPKKRHNERKYPSVDKSQLNLPLYRGNIYSIVMLPLYVHTRHAY